MDDALGAWLTQRPVLEVAPTLLGATLRHETLEGAVAVRLTEVEAYAGPDDPGSHAFRGPTARNATMFGPPGHLYVYLIYGAHHCCNVVVGAEGEASAVLLRAGQVVEGDELARGRRGGVPDRDLARGPGRLCQALGINRTHDGADLRDGPLRLEPCEEVTAFETGPRVGLRAAADHPWRFWIPGEPSVSRFVPAKPRTRRTTET